MSNITSDRYNSGADNQISYVTCPLARPAENPNVMPCPRLQNTFRISFKLAFILDGRYLNAQDQEFVTYVTADIAYFQKTASPEKVLLFPPVTPYHRLLIHRTAQEDFQGLHSFSIGEGDSRRTVICLQTLWQRAALMDGYDGSSHRGVNANQRHRQERPSPDRWGHADIDLDPPPARQSQSRPAKYIPPRGRTAAASWEHDNRGSANDVEPYARGHRPGHDPKRGGEYIAPRGGFRSDYEDRGQAYEEHPVRGSGYRGHDDRSQDGHSTRSNYEPRLHSDVERSHGHHRDDKSREGDKPSRDRGFADSYEERRGHGGRRSDGHPMTPNQHGHDRANNDHHSNHGGSPGTGDHAEMTPRSRGQHHRADKIERPPSNERNMNRSGKSKRPDVQVYVPRGRRSGPGESQSSVEDQHPLSPTSPPAQQQQQPQQSKRQHANKDSAGKRKSNPGGNVDYHQDWSKELEEESEKKGKGKKKLQPIEVYVPRPKRREQEESAYLLDPTDNWEELADEEPSAPAESERKAEAGKRPSKKGAEEGKRRDKKKQHDRDARGKQKNSSSSRHGNFLLDAYTIDDVTVPMQANAASEDSEGTGKKDQFKSKSKKHSYNQTKLVESAPVVAVDSGTNFAVDEQLETDAGSEKTADDTKCDLSKPVMPETEEDIVESWEDMADEAVIPGESSGDLSLPAESTSQVVPNDRSHLLESDKPQKSESLSQSVPALVEDLDTQEIAMESDSRILSAPEVDQMEEEQMVVDENESCQHLAKQDSLDDSADLNIDAEVQAWINSETDADDVQLNDQAVENSCDAVENEQLPLVSGQEAELVSDVHDEECREERTVGEKDCAVVNDSSDALENDHSSVHVPNHIAVNEPGELRLNVDEPKQTSSMNNDCEMVSEVEVAPQAEEVEPPSVEASPISANTANEEMTKTKRSKKVNSKPSDAPEEKGETEPRVKLEVRSKPKKKKRVPKEDGPTFSKNKKENAVLNDIWETFGRGNEEEDSKKADDETPVEPAQVVKPVPAADLSDDDWDQMFDDNGDALDAKAVEEITSAIGQVKVEKTQFDYYNYQPKDPELDDDTYGHLIEIYDFPTEFQTCDLLVVFKDFKERGFDIKWVDDTHAIGMFASSLAAKEALELKHPLIKLRPISVASRQTKVKAKKNSDFLEPYKPRPETTAHVARNLVANALGLKTRVPKEKRDEERKRLKEAKEKKKATTKQRDEAWEGTIGVCAMDR